MAIRHLRDFRPFRSSKVGTAWIGAASFEERSVASLRELHRQSAALSRIVLLDYKTSIRPGGEGEAQRADNLADIRALARILSGRDPELAPVDPYSFRAGGNILESLIGSGCGQLIVDISCLTKIHTIAIATKLGTRQDPGLETYLVYAVPENYPGISSSASAEGWTDIIVGPLSETARLFNENSGRGIILVGHEADRLIVGLSEIEPAGGSIVLTWSRRRPDLGEVSSRRNLQLTRHLEAMRVADWKRCWLELCDFEGLSDLVESEVVRASEKRAPVILFPYGPKPHVFGMTYELARRYFENSWFVYPVPASYDATYSEGVGEVLWLHLSNVEAAG